MLDLNIGAEFSVDSVSCDDETDRKTIYNTVDASSVTSTTVPADDHDSNSSSPGNSIPTLNFSILQEKVVEIDDRANNGVISNRYESQLFPVSALSSTPVADMAKHWLNLSVPEASGAGGVGLGIFTTQLPLNNRMQQQGVKTCRRGPRPRSSQYRGVTFYRRTGRWESHIWDCGKQVYLGGFDTAYAAARAYDRAAVKFRGIDADINFNISDYEEDMKQMKNLTKEEFVQILRRQNTGSQGSSKYRGITLHKYGRWEARMGPFVEETAYGKATNVRNPGQTIACFEPSSYKRNISMISSDGGIVDLNLGISVASDDPHRNDIAPDGKRVEERAAVMSAEGIPSPGCSNRSLEVQSHGVPLLSSAASSGFSSTTAPNSNSLM